MRSLWKVVSGQGGSEKYDHAQVRNKVAPMPGVTDMRRGYEGLFALARVLLDAESSVGIALAFVIEAVID